MERRDSKKQVLAIVIAVILISLILLVLTPPATAVILSPGTLSTSDQTPNKGDTITFRNVNLTIEGNEAIPLTWLNFSIKKTSGDTLVAYVHFSADGTELLDPTGKFAIIDTTYVSGIPYNSSSGYGYDWNNGVGYTFDYGYGYRNSSDILTILYNITFATDNLAYSTSYYAKFYVYSFDGTNRHNYSSTTTTSFTTNAESSGGSDTTLIAPTADPGGPYSGYAGSSVSFDGSGSSDSDGSIVSYAWTFGDGSTGSGVAPSHTYNTAGTYNVVLTVTDDDGLTNTASTPVSYTHLTLPTN